MAGPKQQPLRSDVMDRVDIARHAARADARGNDYSEDEALRRIVDTFAAEIARPTDAGTTAPRSQRGH